MDKALLLQPSSILARCNSNSCLQLLCCDKQSCLQSRKASKLSLSYTLHGEDRTSIGFIGTSLQEESCLAFPAGSSSRLHSVDHYGKAGTILRLSQPCKAERGHRLQVSRSFTDKSVTRSILNWNFEQKSQLCPTYSPVKVITKPQRSLTTAVRNGACPPTTEAGTPAEADGLDEGSLEDSNDFLFGSSISTKTREFDSQVDREGDGWKGNVTTRKLSSALHETAARIQAEMEEQEALSRGPWFAQRWLGIDRNAWMKPLSYQGAALAMLKAAMEVADRGDGRDRVVHISCTRSLARQCSPLEKIIQESLVSKDPGAEVWFYGQLHPPAVMAMLDLLERDPRFASVACSWKDSPALLDVHHDMALLDLVLHVEGAVARLGSAALSCPAFSEALAEETSRLLAQLAAMAAISYVYATALNSGLRREFLDTFSARAGGHGVPREGSPLNQERSFWVNLVQQQLQGAFHREGVGTTWVSRQSCSEVESDLAVFGFFAVLGRRTRSYLRACGADADEAVAALLRYLEGASVLFYPELTNLPTYQLFVEVASEEMAWLAFYPGRRTFDTAGGGHGHSAKDEHKATRAETEAALNVARNTCARWLSEFATHSEWLRGQKASRAAKFLAKSQQRLQLGEQIPTGTEGQLAFDDDSSEAEPSIVGVGRQAMAEVGRSLEGLLADGRFPAEYYLETGFDDVPAGGSYEDPLRGLGKGERVLQSSQVEGELVGLQRMRDDLRMFELELRTVEAVIRKLELLLDEDAAQGRGGLKSERLTAACRELENLRRLQGEVAATEAALKMKAARKEERIRRKQEAEMRYRRWQQNQASDVFATDGASSTGSSNTGMRSRKKLADYVGDMARAVSGAATILIPFARTQDDAADRAPLARRVPVDYGKRRMASPLQSQLDMKNYNDSAAAAIQQSASLSSTDLDRFNSLREALAQLEVVLRQSRAEISTTTPANSVGLDAALSSDLYTASSASTAGADSAERELAIPGNDVSSQSQNGPEDSEGSDMELSARDAEFLAPSPGMQLELQPEVAGKSAEAYGSMFNQAIEKLKDSASDAWRGTQLLTADSGVALTLLRRSALHTGPPLTEREKKILRRTLTDLASVVPIAFLMLLPVTAVGHAAILAAIQKYVPGLIPSAYGAERLDVARRLEQLRDMPPEHVGADEAHDIHHPEDDAQFNG